MLIGRYIFCRVSKSGRQKFFLEDLVFLKLKKLVVSKIFQENAIFPSVSSFMLHISVDAHQ